MATRCFKVVHVFVGVAFVDFGQTVVEETNDQMVRTPPQHAFTRLDASYRATHPIVSLFRAPNLQDHVSRRHRSFLLFPALPRLSTYHIIEHLIF
ncbi:hypothetical protein BKA93DRAFT_797864 [Sparassis latifolia]